LLLKYVDQDREHLYLETLGYFGAPWLPFCVFIIWLYSVCWINATRVESKNKNFYLSIYPGGGNGKNTEK